VSLRVPDTDPEEVEKYRRTLIRYKNLDFKLRKYEKENQLLKQRLTEEREKILDYDKKLKKLRNKIRKMKRKSDTGTRRLFAKKPRREQQVLAKAPRNREFCHCSQEETKKINRLQTHDYLAAHQPKEIKRKAKSDSVHKDIDSSLVANRQAIAEWNDKFGRNNNKKKDCPFDEKYESRTQKSHCQCNQRGMKCGLMDETHWKTPPFYLEDPFCICTGATNNTFQCMRTINETDDFLYCDFAFEGIREFYDMKVSNTRNQYYELSEMKRKILSNNLVDLIKCRGADSCNMKNGQIVSIESKNDAFRNRIFPVDPKSKSSYSRRKIKDPVLRRKFKGCRKAKNKWKRRCYEYYDWVRSKNHY